MCRLLSSGTRRDTENGDKEIMYLEKAKTHVEELQRDGLVGELVPCTEEEVRKLEYWLQCSLPPAYKEFLFWTGHYAGGLLKGTNWLYQDIYHLYADAIKLMEHDSFPVTLPTDAIVFLMHEQYQFGFFRASEGDDPPVYYYIESDDEIALKISTRHYSEFLLQVIQTESNVLRYLKKRKH